MSLLLARLWAQPKVFLLPADGHHEGRCAMAIHSIQASAPVAHSQSAAPAPQKAPVKPQAVQEDTVKISATAKAAPAAPAPAPKGVSAEK